jgi:UbiD family decarboxylase
MPFPVATTYRADVPKIRGNESADARGGRYIGGQPVIPIVSCLQLPPYVNEVEVAGALQNAPIPLVRGETVDLDVPASAEIILEGEVLPHERMVEGPFGEYMGYEAGKSSPKPIMKINAITHRNDPILPFSNMGMPVHEGQTATALIKGAEIYSELRKLGLPVKGVFCPLKGSSVHPTGRTYGGRIDRSPVCEFCTSRSPRSLGD